MNLFISLASSLAIFQTLVAGTTIPIYFQKHHVTRRDLSSTQVQQELGRQLFNTTTIFGTGDSRFDNATVRWNVLAVPKIQAVIEPGQESDISIIVSNNGQFYYQNP